MAATTINVSEVKNGLNNARKQISQQEEALGQIDTTVNSMSGVWEAEDQRAYAEQFKSTKQKIENFNASLTETLQNIGKFVDDCVTADDQTGRELRSISW